MGYGQWTRVMRLAELICHQCGTVTHTGLPTYRMGTMPRCDCGGRSQVVRIVERKQDRAEPTRHAESEQDTTGAEAPEGVPVSAATPPTPFTA